jgi:dethiobiotin synthetase
MEALKKQGNIVTGMKPIASGATLYDGTLINDDASLIMKHCSEPTNYDLINPFNFELPVAPHIAANRENENINPDQIVDCYHQLASKCERIVVEGVGGWRVPISNKKSIVDLVRLLDLPVILVVGFKLGCINHAILTAEAIRADGIRLIGWVSNQLDEEYLCAEETIEALKNTLFCPYIANLSYMRDFDPKAISTKIDLTHI